MLTVTIHEVDNLPTTFKKPHKTLISIFSTASYRYYYGSFKTKNKSTHPIWNSTVTIELFRLVELNFSLYHTKLCAKNVFIGNVHIDFLQFLSKHPGDQILKNPGMSVRSEFPVSILGKSGNSYLSLSFTFCEKIYRPIEFQPVKYYEQLIHIWSSFSPSMVNSKPQVEIEFLQVSPIYDQNRRNTNHGVFYNLNKDTAWETTGKSSSPHFFQGESGLSQIHSLCMTKIDGYYTFFVLNVFDFSGTVKVHFVCEKKGKFRHFSDRIYMKPKIKNPKIGVVETVEVQVTPNTKKLLPLFHHFDSRPNKSKSKVLFRITNNVEITKNEGDENLEIQFQNEVMKNVKSIQEISKVHFLRETVLPIFKSVSLKKICRDYEIQYDTNLRFYVGGSTTYTSGESVVVDYWKQGFIVFDKTNGQRCPQISEEMKTKNRSSLPSKLKWNSIIGLNLNSIGTDKIFVYYIYCDSFLEEAGYPGFFMISHMNQQNETLLIRNEMFPEVCKEHFAICFRIEYIENDWQFIPMRHYFKERKDMEFVLDSMHANNWNMPEILLNQRKTDHHIVDFSDDDFLITDE